MDKIRATPDSLKAYKNMKWAIGVYIPNVLFGVYLGAKSLAIALGQTGLTSFQESTILELFIIEFLVSSAALINAYGRIDKFLSFKK